MKLPKFLASSYFSREDGYEFTSDVSDVFRTKYNPNPQMDYVTVNFKCYDIHNVDIQDVAANKTYKFTKDTCDMDDYMEEDAIEYTVGQYEWGNYFEFDEDECKYTEVEPFKYFNEFAYNYIESGKHDFLYLTDGFEDLNLLIPECAEDQATNLETIEDVTEFMKSLGYERLGA